MTKEEAIRLLDPETTANAIAEIEYYGGFSGREAAIKAIEDACVLAVEALKEKTVEHAHWKHEEWAGDFCSNCGKPAIETRYAYQILSAYCPHCGAQMDEEENR